MQPGRAPDPSTSARNFPSPREKRPAALAPWASGSRWCGAWRLRSGCGAGEGRGERGAAARAGCGGGALPSQVTARRPAPGREGGPGRLPFGSPGVGSATEPAGWGLPGVGPAGGLVRPGLGHGQRRRRRSRRTAWVSRPPPRPKNPAASAPSGCFREGESPGSVTELHPEPRSSSPRVRVSVAHSRAGIQDLTEQPLCILGQAKIFPRHSSPFPPFLEQPEPFPCTQAAALYPLTPFFGFMLTRSSTCLFCGLTSKATRSGDPLMDPLPFFRDSPETWVPKVPW